MSENKIWSLEKLAKMSGSELYREFKDHEFYKNLSDCHCINGVKWKFISQLLEKRAKWLFVCGKEELIKKEEDKPLLDELKDMSAYELFMELQKEDVIHFKKYLKMNDYQKKLLEESKDELIVDVLYERARVLLREMEKDGASSIGDIRDIFDSLISITINLQGEVKRNKKSGEELKEFNHNEGSRSQLIMFIEKCISEKSRSEGKNYNVLCSPEFFEFIESEIIRDIKYIGGDSCSSHKTAMSSKMERNKTPSKNDKFDEIMYNGVRYYSTPCVKLSFKLAFIEDMYK